MDNFAKINLHSMTMTTKSLHNTYDYNHQEQDHDNPSTSFKCLQTSITKKHYTLVPFTPLQALCIECTIWFI